MEYSYVWEKFFGATMSLIGEGSLKVRLEYAAQKIIVLRNQTLPDPIKDDVLLLLEDLTSGNPTGDEGRISATIMRMSDEEARTTAQRILGILDGIAPRMRPNKKTKIEPP